MRKQRTEITCLRYFRKLAEQVIGYGPVEDVEVFLNSCFVRAFGKHAVAQLESPTKCHLSRSLAQFLCYGSDNWILKDIALERSRARGT